MTTHDAYMIGTNWLRTSFAPEYQKRGECQACHTTETMDHILIKCTSNGQAQIWQYVRKLWTQKEKKDLVITLGTILTSPSTVLKENGQDKIGATRLYRIMISESAYLIWKLRCERVIQKGGEEIPLTEVKNK
jgi:hypothetical protein